MRLIDLTNQTFGYLTVIERSENKGSKVMWKCKCKCGNEILVSSGNLRSGNTKSCGCYQKERTSQALLKDLTGQKFGHLTVIERDFNNPNNTTYWLCKCDCGSSILKSVSSTNLKNGHVSSCGCMSRVSKGEQKIQEILLKNNIPFEVQKTFDDCVYENNYKARFDFFVNNQYIIEYDGEQHFKLHSASIWNDRHSIEQTQKNDEFKNKYCFQHNIPIIRIPYTHYENICLEDLLPNTSNFIIKEVE